MPNDKLKSLWSAALSWLKAYPWQERLLTLRSRLKGFLASWWKWLLGAFAALIFLYYPLGGWMVHKIDTTTDYEINTAQNQSATVEMMAFLVRREVSDKIWTPNLPFIFPSYFLDNMPNFQLGLMSAVSNTATAMSKRMEKPIASQDDRPLQTAAKLLNYPGTIWMFSPTNKLTPVPSAGNQYKKARKQLIAYNRDLRNGNIPFYKSPSDLRYFVSRMTADLWKSNAKLETAVREKSSDWFDFQADNIFYYQKGKLYGYYLLFKALGRDYKEVIVNSDLYQPWTQMLSALEQGALLSPSVVRNGSPGSVTAPNHLAQLGWYTLKAATLGRSIVYKLEPQVPANSKVN